MKFSASWKVYEQGLGHSSQPGQRLSMLTRVRIQVPLVRVTRTRVKVKVRRKVLRRATRFASSSETKVPVLAVITVDSATILL